MTTRHITSADSVNSIACAGKLSKKQVNAVWYSLLKCAELSIIPDEEIGMVMDTAKAFAKIYDEYDNGGNGYMQELNQVNLLNAYHALTFVMDNKQFETEKQRQHAKKARIEIYKAIDEDKISSLGMIKNKIIVWWRVLQLLATRFMKNYGTEMLIMLFVIVLGAAMGLAGVFDVSYY